MGRARSTAGTDGFNQVFGAHRGSAAGNALAAREREREGLLRERATVNEHARKFAVVVTMRDDNRRYVVAEEDEEEVRGLAGVSESELKAVYSQSWGGFGGQWLRGFGRVDEMYRTLSFAEVKKVAEIERSKVWGRERSR
jgi:hypothetical protein